MGKLKLDPESLEVQSFATAAPRPFAGTVFPRQATAACDGGDNPAPTYDPAYTCALAQCTDGHTCGETCLGTCFGGTCVGDSCGELTCAGGICTDSYSPATCVRSCMDVRSACIAFC